MYSVHMCIYVFAVCIRNRMKELDETKYSQIELRALQALRKSECRISHTHALNSVPSQRECGGFRARPYTTVNTLQAHARDILSAHTRARTAEMAMTMVDICMVSSVHFVVKLWLSNNCHRHRHFESFIRMISTESTTHS